MKIEAKELVKALTPFYNGCSFSLRVMASGEYRIYYGCYCLVHLVHGAQEYLRELISGDLRSDKDYERYIILEQYLCVDNINEVKATILKELINPCRHCGSPLFQKRRLYER